MSDNNSSLDAFTSAIRDALDTEGRLSRLEEKADTREKEAEALKASIEGIHTRISSSKKEVIEEMHNEKADVLKIREEDKKELKKDAKEVKDEVATTRKYAAGILITLVIILVETVIAFFFRG